MSIRQSVASLVALVAAILGGIFLYLPFPKVGATIASGSMSESGVYNVDLLDEGFRPERLEVNLGSLPAGTGSAVKIDLRNRQTRTVRLFGSSSTCDQYGCTRTMIPEDKVEPGAIVRVEIEPLFKSNPVLATEANVYAGSNQLFKWSIKVHADRVDVPQ